MDNRPAAPGYAVARVLAESSTCEQAYPRILSAIGHTLAQAPIALWEGGQAADLRRVAVWPPNGPPLAGGRRYPILAATGVLGAIELPAAEVAEPDESFTEIMANLGYQIGQFVARCRADDAVRAHRRPAETWPERFFELSNDMLCTANSAGYLTRVNPAFERTLGYSAEEVQAVPFLDFVHPLQRPESARGGEK